ncbi:aldo/keto reductase [Apilactobacillus micheneri]|uniref:aldo/keto reductase n=1 Tax=Apilactobacillus micheneri TaxID=1899430 RepID=UPI00112CC8FF|nr:aldo/keto reductase [Apilactobacillus micheneri]TPR38993.1 aldo/keto reductase [Apilactobacillus micheneri]
MSLIDFNGISVPNIGIGTWHMGSDSSNYERDRDVITYGIQHGANVIDTAEMYGSGDSELLVGDAIKGLDRDKIFLISKFYPNNAIEPNLSRALDGSLKRLDTDYLDLYLYHWRGSEPLDKTVAELETLKQKGKIRHWGVSNFDIDDMQELVGVPNGKNVFTNEDLYNMGVRGIEYSLLPWQRKHNLPLIAYAPMDEGDSRHHNIERNSVLQKVADKHNVSVYQVMLAWTIRDKNTIAIPQTTSKKHMLDNIAAGKIKLDKDDLDMINTAFPAPNHKTPLDII